MKADAGRGRRALAALVVLGALSFLGIQLFADWSSVETALQAYLIGGLLIALAVAMIAVTLAGLAWWAILKSLRVRLRPGDALGVYFLSRIGVYLPGSIWPTYAEQRLRLDLRAPLRVSASADAAHTALVVVTAVAFIGSALLPSGGAAWLGRLILFALVLSLLAPPVTARIIAVVAPETEPRNDVDAAPRVPLAAIALQTLAWLASGLALTALVAPFNPMQQGDLARLIGIAGLAWIVGRVGATLAGQAAPDGLGIRDITLWVGLLSFADPGAAALVTLLYRLLTVISDMTLASMSTSSTAFRIYRAHTRPERPQT